MGALVLYDSRFGNTEKVAQVIAKAIDVEAIFVGDVKAEDVSHETIIIGSPTHGGRPTETISTFISQLDSNEVKHAACFDTRFDSSNVSTGLRVLMGVIGYAAPKMASLLKKKGIEIQLEPAGFIVTDKEGPLREGELERAKKWVRTLVS